MFGFIVLILLSVAATGWISFTAKEPDVHNLTQGDILNDSTIYRFGADHVIMKSGESPDFQERIALLENVTDESDRDIESWYYPHGPILCFGYGADEVDVGFYNQWDVNETTARDIYAIIERHGEQHGIDKIPCRFWSGGMVELDLGTSRDSNVTILRLYGDTPLLDVTPLPEYSPGEQVVISGTTSLPAGEVLDIALIKEPFHTTKCDPGTFCGSNTYSTTVSAGPGSNVWSYSLDTTGFPEGGYDIWVVSRNQPNTSVHTALYLRECPRSENATPWIHITPVGDHAIGEIITISGTTSYPINTMLWISLGPKVFTNYPPNYFDGQILVVPGKCSNVWQVTINTSAFVIDEYSVRVEPVNSTPLFSSAMFFNMTAGDVSKKETPSTSVIMIDPIGNHTTDDIFFINGTTNLAVSNASLLLRIDSAEFNPGGFGSSFYSLNVSITRGEHGMNVWSAEIVPSEWEMYTKPPNYYPTPAAAPAVPGRYQVVISSLNSYEPDIVAMQDFFIISAGTGNISGTPPAGELSSVATAATEYSRSSSGSPTLPSALPIADPLIALGVCIVAAAALRRG